MSRNIHRAAAWAAALAAMLLAAESLLAEDQTLRGIDPRGSSESVFSGKELVERRIYDPEGRLLEDRVYRSGKIWETRNYFRSAGLLRSVKLCDSGGSVIGRLRYVYDTSGRLLRVDSSGAFGDSSAGMICSGSSPLASWTIRGEHLSLLKYDSQGRPILSVATENGKPVATSSEDYSKNSLPRHRVEENASTGLTRSTDYDESGRPILVVVTKGSEQVSRTEYRYDASGRLVEERSGEGLGRLSKRLFYSPDGKLSREEYRTGGVLRKIVLHPGADRVEELYNDGVMFVRVSYSEGRKVEEDFFLDGHLAWTRKYP